MGGGGCCSPLCCPIGLEGWAAAVGDVEVPLHWADGEIGTEWDKEEPLDLRAPGMCWAPGVCSALCDIPLPNWDQRSQKSGTSVSFRFSSPFLLQRSFCRTSV